MSLTSPNRGWTLEEIEYDSGQLEGIHGDLLLTKDSGRNASLVLRNVEAGLDGNGDAIDRAKVDAGVVAAEITPTAAVLGRIANVVRDYGEAVSQHARAANDLIDDIESAHNSAQVAQANLTEAQSDQSTAADGDDAAALATADQSLTDSQSALSSASSALSDLWEQWEAAYAQWDDAYGDAIARLARVENSTIKSTTLDAINQLANADSPEEVAEIWAGLTDDQRSDLHADHAGFIGNLEGVPYLDRFIANKAVYDATIAAGPYDSALDGQLEALGVELARFDGQLLMFNPFENPQATAAVMYGVRIEDDQGNPVDPLEGITNVNVLVGGMFSSLDDLEAWGDSARNLNSFAEGYGNGGGSATIAWYGYDSPNMATEHTMGSATEGAATLTQTLQGLNNEVSPQVTTSVIGHSYGSTTAFLAVGGADDTLGVDQLIAVGSAGVPDGYHSTWTGDEPMDYSGTEIFASRAPGDLVARYGEHSSFGHGMNPEELPGAISFESDGGDVPTLEGGGIQSVEGTPGHAAHDGGNSFWGWWEDDNGYLSRDSESFRNIANIVANGEPIN